MIAFFIMLMIACGAAEVISLFHALDGVDYDCRLSQSIVEPEQTVDLITTITNERRRFIPFLRLSENVPQGFTCTAQLEVGSVTQKRSTLRSTVYLMPRQRLTRRVSFSLPERGRYLFLGAELNGGDFLGFSERKHIAELFREIVVLPKPIASEVLDALPGGLMGDVSVNRFIHEDPMLNIGYREYTGREPMKMISWTQTARTGELMVKIPDHTIERSATVVLNAHTFAFGSYGEQLLEKAYSLARGICEQLEEMRIPYSFFTNARAAGGTGSYEAGDGLGQAHLQPVLEGLGRATYAWTESVWSLVDRASRTGDEGRTFIFITPMKEDVEEAELSRIAQRTGIEPKVIVIMEVMP